VLIGGERHLAMLPGETDGRERLPWPRRCPHWRSASATCAGRVCVLATGDPMQFGIGATLARHVSPDEMTILPGVSAFAPGGARPRLAARRVAMVTLHGRPLETWPVHISQAPAS
jgi:precorrin-6Y C5,15-methyltransferase (decarboxylating)